jgi:hypothetical protein
LVTVMVPPTMSWGAAFPARAASVSLAISSEMATIPSLSASRTTGTNSPCSVSVAIPTW